MFRRLLLLTIGLAFIATACTSEGLPSSYSDQDNRAEKQFVAACESAVGDEQEEGYCQCAFYTIAAERTFDEFLKIDNDLKDDPEGLLFPERDLIESVSLPCQFTAADIRG